MNRLNERACILCDEMAAEAERLNVAVSFAGGGTRVIDCGVARSGDRATTTVGGLEAGRRLAEVCLGGCGRVDLGGGVPLAAPRLQATWATQLSPCLVTIRTDQPLLGCLASQYAGWQITGEKFFAMGSGPMRAVARKEKIFEELGLGEEFKVQGSMFKVVGVLETSKIPPDEVCEKIARDCGVSPKDLTLLVARTASIAGTVQIVARSVETALHKLHAIGYDVKNIVSGIGSAPLPPVAADDLVGIGRTNDAVLYGGEVTLWVRDDDVRLAEIGPKVPSSASKDFGEPFGAIFERYGRDFYKIDPLLFSPAVVTFVNLASGKMQRFGEVRPDVLERSFGTSAS